MHRHINYGRLNLGRNKLLLVSTSCGDEIYVYIYMVSWIEAGEVDIKKRSRDLLTDSDCCFFVFSAC